MPEAQAWSDSLRSASASVRLCTSATSASGSWPSFMNDRMCMMGSAPWAATSAASCRGRCALSTASSSGFSATRSASATRASRSFIFMYGQVAQPPAVLQPSPAGTPGTTPRPPSTAVTASLATGKTMSTSTSSPAAPASRRCPCTPSTMELIMPDSVPSTTLTRCSPSPSATRCAASCALPRMKPRMSDVEPTTPRPSIFAAMASSNISPGTSRCAEM
mmetsp:Transcript_6781/g.19628  ORF Transcript_6781/g.19628 Transcript_6781/m.19628 type:complete len:219 (+) Transcript_6781:169-825(+)